MPNDPRRFITRLTDRFVLQPTTHAIEPRGKQRHAVSFGGGELEFWVQRTGGAASDDTDVFVLKLHGVGGRAERSTVHPADFWPHLNTEVWAMNLPGYGGSVGPASLQPLGAALRLAYDTVDRIAAGRPVIVAGNSLGAAGALHVAATRDADGILARNPPPLRQLIVGRYGWWNLGLGAGLIARQVPTDLCGIANAAAAKQPAVFLMSGKDRVVPPRFQRRIHDAYQAEKRVVPLAEADHASPLTPAEERVYRQAVNWLLERATARHDLPNRRAV